MAPPNSVLSTTLQLLRDKLVDNSFISHPLFRAIEAAGNRKMVSGGMRIDQPVMFGSHSSITELTNGFEPVSLAVSDPFTKAQFEWCNFTAPIVLSDVEKLANKGDLAIVNILESKVQNVMIDLKLTVSKRIFGAAKSTSALTTLQTLNGMTTAAGTGWLEGVAQASQDNVVGGLSKVTYQADNWYNQFQDAAGTLALEDLTQLMINCQVHNPSGDAPDIIFMSQNCYGAFLALIQDQVRYAPDDKVQGGMVPTWRGAKIYIEPTLGFTAEAPAKAVSAYVLTSSQFALYADTDGWFNMGPMLPVPGTATEAARIMCRMQLVTGSLATHGVLLDAEA
jgi:hypothetical protein